MTNVEPAEPPVPDFVRQRIRSAAQAFGSWLSALIVAGLARWLGADMLPAELGNWLTYVIVPFASAALILVYIVGVQLLARVWSGAEGLFFGRSGTPTYVDVTARRR